MPNALKKQMFGLPRWAWISILMAAVAVGLYLRHKKKLEEEAEAQAESEGGTTGAEQPVSAGIAESGYEGAGVQGGGEYYPSAEGYYPSYEYPYGATVGQEAPESVVVNVNSPTQPSATDETPPPSSSSGGSGTPCHQAKPKAKAGGHYQCVSGRWQFVAGSSPHSGGGAAVVTGGGPPDKKNNKHPGVGTVHENIGQGVAVATAPQNNAQHPAAVNTGNPCVNGGVGKHTAPSGYHLFCQGGWIWRAPNS